MDRDELREVKSTHPQIEGELRRTSRIHFWTEKGALLHAKSLNTDKAWEVYDYLVDFYFRAKEKAVDPEKKEIVPVEIREEPIKEESSIQVTGEDEISVFKALLKIAEKREKMCIRDRCAGGSGQLCGPDRKSDGNSRRNRPGGR